jgi:hypothetical protein
MSKRIKDLWVAALRSGEYKQTQKLLKDENGHCCLGVLCELYQKENEVNIEVSNKAQDGRVYSLFLTEPAVLPLAVMKWAGLLSQDGRPRDYQETTRYPKLTAKNDEGASFKEIADIIEKYPEQYFCNDEGVAHE